MKIIFKSPLFWIGTTIKIIFLFFGGAEIFHKLFIPFLDTAVTHIGVNPWSFFPTHYFPYGSTQLLIFALPKYLMTTLFGTVALGDQPLSYFSVKIVLLVFDFLLFKQLLPLAQANEKKLLVYYWLNPILFYISYVHGQLDVVSMFFSITSILALTRNQLFRFSTFAALAVLSKFHTIAILPLAMAYLWNTNFRREGISKILQSSFIIFGLLLVGFFPQIISHQMSSLSVGSPEAMTIFAAQLPISSTQTIYLGFLLIVGVLSRLCVSTRITAEGLIFGSGIIFGTIILGSAASAGWYFWFIPFVALFYSTWSFKFNLLFVASHALYLAYFFSKDFLGDVWSDALLQSVMFSLLQFSILCLIVSIWISVIVNESPLLRRVRPLMIGLAGNSGSGKNTMTSLIQNLFGKKSAAVVEGDDYHKWERGNARWQDYTHLNPKANFLDNMASHTRALSAGKLVFQPHYDHGAGQFTQPRPIETSKNLIVQGLHTFYLLSLRQLFDIKIFLAPDEELRTIWKIKRDVSERGHALEKIINSIRARELDSLMYITPQKKWADWIIESKMKNPGPIDLENVNLNPDFYVRHIVWNDTPLAPLAEHLNRIANVKTNIELYSENIDRVSVTFQGDLTAEQVEQVALASFPYLRHLTRTYQAPCWQSGNEGLSQLVLLALIERHNFLRK